MITEQRKSYTAINKIYFWTATHKWISLLDSTINKQIIIDSLKYLSDRELITVYVFVIMPNHIHFIWQQNNLNGKEIPKESFLKHSSHLLLKELKANGNAKYYEVNKTNKKHKIWERDSLGVEIYSREIAKQKLNYIHFNSVTGKWKLSKDDLYYYFSSAKFYETGVDDFGFLHNIFKIF